MNKENVRAKTRIPLPLAPLPPLPKHLGTVGNPATIQAAVWYLDTVLATCNVPNNVQLEAAAAYLIASKHRGPRTRTSKLITCAGFAFTKEKLLEKELDILLTLKFPCQPVVPQDYICYFAWWCKEERAGEIEVASTFLCLCGMMVDKSLRPEYPSVVAAASVKNALLLLKRNELMPRLHRCPAFAAAEEKADNMIHTCVILRNAVREVASNNYTYMFILEQYGMPPKYIAQTLVDAARERSVMDSMITTQHV
ncbi:uncharacterized protein LOC133524842 isoform X2 [Cydia pomonella]|uniref:uncharacterized protein LOC133524842 isoform X2 n=1 Tax=Cydia pomonella TaxID=82600 RepID=UPI002ADE5EB9|nr:uncharacterized protein LOC133524842 isoform X2 [Cydia pomonella]